MRMARVYVPSAAVAEEVVQETWLGVLRGLERFEGRSSFRTWVFQIALNQARTRGERERRTIPFASLADHELGGDAPAQRVVITLRDVHGCESAEVCNALGVTETNQRVLLHRARSRVRAELETYFADA